jgi:hypothetical protein
MTDIINNQPRILRIIATKIVRRGKFFRFSVRKTFEPQTSSMQYELVGEIPKWLNIDTRSGIVSGKAPMVLHDQQYLVMVSASNETGSIQQRFSIKVVCTDIVEEMAHRLMEMLSLSHQLYPFPDENPNKPSLLAYIYEYFVNSDEKNVFLQLLQEHAEKLGIVLSAELSFRDFKKIVTALSANIEQILLTAIDANLLQTLAELDNVDFHRLFRQGSQPLGAIAIPVWNYLAAPDRYNFSAVGNVLDSAAEAVSKLRNENIQDQNTHKPTPTPRPK